MSTERSEEDGSWLVGEAHLRTYLPVCRIVAYNVQQARRPVRGYAAGSTWTSFIHACSAQSRVEGLQSRCGGWSSYRSSAASSLVVRGLTWTLGRFLGFPYMLPSVSYS